MGRVLFRFLVVTLAVLLWALGGCVNLGKGTQQTTRFYVLYSLSSPVTGTEAARPKRDLAIGVGPVELPQYLNRSQIVTRASRSELQVAEFARWAEPLEENLARVLAENLSILLSTDRIAVYPWKRWTPIDYQVTVDVTRFDGQPGGDVSLRARWTVLGDDGKKVLIRKQSNFSEPAGTLEYRDLVSAQSRMIAELSRQIAAEIKAVSQQVPDQAHPSGGQ